MQRNEYVLKNMFGSFFLATVLTALMAQLGSIADSIVIGHLVSPDALSVVRIWQPVENFMYIIIGMMGAGACFLSARGIGAPVLHEWCQLHLPEFLPHIDITVWLCFSL